MSTSQVFISDLGFSREKVAQKNIIFLIMIFAAILAIFKAGEPDFKRSGSERFKSMTKEKTATSSESKVFFPENYLSFAQSKIKSRMHKSSSGREDEPVQVTTKW